MIADILFSRKDQLSFNITMACHCGMHLIFTLALPFENFAFVSAIVSAVTFVFWNLLLAPVLTGW